MRKLIKALLPTGAYRMTGQWLLRRRESSLSKLSLPGAFNAIYRRHVWGRDKPSGAGSYGTWAREYVSYVLDFVAARDIRTVYDAGCGDFNVGAQLAPHIAGYIASDISEVIITRNRKIFGHLHNVEFLNANICEDPIPNVDLVIVRQVFQHLTNAQIELALANIEKSRPRYIIVADHVTKTEKMLSPNLDLPTHSFSTRVSKQSGVVLSASPFSRHATLVKSIPGDSSVPVSDDSVLAIYVIRCAERATEPTDCGRGRRRTS
jgi:SAM-dependent methyltransferase